MYQFYSGNFRNEFLDEEREGKKNISSMGGVVTIINNCCKRPLRVEMTLIDDLEQNYLPLSHLAVGSAFSINTLISDWTSSNLVFKKIK